MTVCDCCEELTMDSITICNSCRTDLENEKMDEQRRWDERMDEVNNDGHDAYEKRRSGRGE